MKCGLRVCNLTFFFIERKYLTRMRPPLWIQRNGLRNFVVCLEEHCGQEGSLRWTLFLHFVENQTYGFFWTLIFFFESLAPIDLCFFFTLKYVNQGKSSQIFKTLDVYVLQTYVCFFIKPKLSAFFDFYEKNFNKTNGCVVLYGKFPIDYVL